MSKEIRELADLYSTILMEEDKENNNNLDTKLKDLKTDEKEKQEGIKIKLKGGGYKMIYPGHPNYQAAKDGTFTGILGSGEGRTQITKNQETGQLEGQPKIDSSDDGTGDENADRKARIKELETKLSKAEKERLARNEAERLENLRKAEENKNKEIQVKPENQNQNGNGSEVKPENQNQNGNGSEVKPDPKTDVKTKKMHPIERRNREIHGDKAINYLKQKQIDFKTMQAKSMMPGAKPGAAKAEFAKLHPTSNIAKELRASKRTTQWYDLESYGAKGKSLLEGEGFEGMMRNKRKNQDAVTADAVPSEKPKPAAPDKTQAPTQDSPPAQAEKKVSPSQQQKSDTKKKEAAPNVKVNPDIKEEKGCGSKKKKKKTYYEGLDAYDSVLSYLIATNQVDTIEEANYVMMEMDGKTIYDIRQLTEGMPSYVRDSIGRQYGTGKYRGQKYTIEDKKNVINWYSGNIPRV